MSVITGGQEYGKHGIPIVALTEAQAKQVHAFSEGGWGQQDVSLADMGVLREYQRSQRNAFNIRTKAQEFEHWQKSFALLQKSNRPDHVAAVKKANSEMRQKFLTAGDVHTDANISNMSIMYGNEDFIGLELMPIVLVDKKTDQIQVYPQRERLEVPDTALDEYGNVKEINESRDTTTYVCEGQGLKNAISGEALSNQDAPLNEMMDLTESIIELCALADEQRIATVCDLNTNYGANTQALAAVNRWDVPGGDPIGIMQLAMRSLWRGRGSADTVMNSTIDVYHTLSRHEDILGLFQYNGSSPGLATPDMIAQFLSADRYLVAAAREQTANEAATAVYGRVWTDNWAVRRVARNPGLRNAVWGNTLRWKMAGIPGVTPNNGLITQQWYDNKAGTAGVFWAKFAYQQTHDVFAPLTGYLVQTPIN
jgi:hypothetical protein